MRRYDFSAAAGLAFILAGGLVNGCHAAAAPPVIGELAIPDAIEAPPVTLPIAEPGPADPTPEEARLVDMASRCRLSSRLRPVVALGMLRVEELAGVPPELRGVTLAAWCGEAAYGLGDEVCSTGPCDGGRARGPLQLHAGLARMCLGLPYAGRATGAVDTLRDSPTRSVECFLAHVERMRARGLCGGSWAYAEVWVARGRRPSSCLEVSGHVARLRRWALEFRRGVK